MTPCTRPSCPDWLEAHWEEWGKEYASRLDDNPGYSFQGKQWEGQRVNKRLLPALRTMTDGHCAYCDWFPTDVGTVETIDHFRPKADYPREVYAWPNLYLCCCQCQQKVYDDALLRPDEAGYRFERFFIYNYKDGTIQANPAASPGDQDRARLTIKNVGLNGGGRPAARQRAVRAFRRVPEAERAAEAPVSAFRYLFGDESREDRLPDV